MNHKHTAREVLSASPVHTTKDIAGSDAKHVVISSFDSLGNPYYNGGGAVVVEMIARWLAQKFEVTIVTAARRSGTEVRNGVRYKYLPALWAGPRAAQLLFHAMLPFTARRMSHDLWIESFTPPFSTSLVPLLSRTQVLGLVQNLSGHNMSVRYRIPFFLIERFGLRFYSDVVALNDADAAQVRRCNLAANVRVIPNSVDIPQLDEEQLGRGDYVLFLGRINTKEKGLDLLVDAYEKSGIDLPLLIAGSGPSREEAKLQALLSASKGKVSWLGYVDGQEKYDLLEGSAFIALPSRHDTFPLVVLEGMAYGKPVVHFDVPGLRWMEGDVRVPCFDVDAFAKSLRELADDETMRGQLGRTARLAARQYARTKMAERYLTLVDQLLEIPERYHSGDPHE